MREAPFRRSNLALGWKLGASLEIDIQGCADDCFVVIHDSTLGPGTTGSGHLAKLGLAGMAGLYHREPGGDADHDAPVTSLAELVAPLRNLAPGPAATLQLDLKIVGKRGVPKALIADAAVALAGLESHIIVGSQCLKEAHALAAAMPAARLGYDPMRAVSRDRSLVADPKCLLRHLERRRDGIAYAYLRYDLIETATARGLPLVKHLIDLGIETDAWTVNPGPQLTDRVLHTLVEAGVRQITTDSPAEIAQRIAALYAV
jgi:glycerophosphoryl diester phosphodiesterase